MKDTQDPGVPHADSTAELIARLHHAIGANETTRILLQETLSELQDSIGLHLSEIDAHLRRLAADLEGREQVPAKSN
jgi:hypothetical protein